MQQPYFLEKSLPLRVAKYIEENDSVSLEVMTDYLIENYKEYRNKKAKMFMKSVKKAYAWEMQCRQKESTQSDSSDIEIDDSDGGGPDIIEVKSKKTPTRKIDPIGEINFNSDHKRRKSSGNIEYLTNGNKSVKHQLQSPMSIGKTPSKRAKLDICGTPAPTPSSRTKKFKVEVPTTTFKDMEGIDNIKSVVFSLVKSLVYKGQDQKYLKRSAVIMGPEGSGKTLFAKALAGQTGASFIHFSATELTGGIAGESERRIKEAFRHAAEMSPCVLLLDKLQSISPNNGPNSRNFERRLCAQIAESINDLYNEPTESRVLVLAETRQSDEMDWNLRSAFKKEIFMPSLNEQSREKVLKLMCPNASFDLSDISKRTPGFVAGDLSILIENAMEKAQERLDMVPTENKDETFAENVDRLIEMLTKTKESEEASVTLADFLDVLPDVVPALKREGFPGVPDVTWEDVGGLEDIKAELREKILDPIKYPEIHGKYGVARPNGILLWGPPGCGKTLLAKALANEAGINFMAVRGPEVLSMYQGESERKIREIFLRARSVAPCVVFFDEFDGICPLRTKGAENGSRTTIVHTLLVEMNGFTSREDVYVMGATNRPDMIDPAVTRPGRFDTLLYIGMPDQTSRIAVLKACSKNESCPRFAPDVSLPAIAEKLNGFSGADCSNLVYLASKAAIKEEISEKMSNGMDDISDCPLDNQEGGSGCVSQRHMVAALKRIRPSVSVESLKRYLKLKRRFEIYAAEGKDATFLDPEEAEKFEDTTLEAVSGENNTDITGTPVQLVG